MSDTLLLLPVDYTRVSLLGCAQHAEKQNKDISSVPCLFIFFVCSGSDFSWNYRVLRAVLRKS